jgi:hypothetical protein
MLNNVIGVTVIWQITFIIILVFNLILFKCFKKDFMKLICYGL